MIDGAFHWFALMLVGHIPGSAGICFCSPLSALHQTRYVATYVAKSRISNCTQLKLPNNTPLYIYSCVCVCKKARVIYKQALMHSTNTGAWRITQSIKYSHTHTHLCSYTIKSARIKNLRFMRVILRELKMEFRAVIISHRDTKRNFMLKCWVKSALKLLTVWAQD